MSALEGSERILQTLDKSTDINVDKERQMAVYKVLFEYEEAITACAQANGCDEVDALEVLLSIGARHGEANGFCAPAEETGAGKRRA